MRAMIQITNSTGQKHYDEIDEQFRCTMGRHVGRNVFEAYPTDRYTIILLDGNQTLIDMGKAKRLEA